VRSWRSLGFRRGGVGGVWVLWSEELEEFGFYEWVEKRS